ncbi:hypothetical protein DFJ58DRAFT_735415 [Suillus subalutaceus]|uniref:uncharacterized protein n=1 Tax=Suillus subalutaceus TaxID=48586 RepID=UPI001B85FEFE|nr:uncharacterized protein DFJ58DRAFT_735415 [Suillus subalutaceus]KAG1835851.1 hypothetical protein DFJ58DRAFT_735415 [Suillus subalutaceus]
MSSGNFTRLLPTAAGEIVLEPLQLRWVGAWNFTSNEATEFERLGDKYARTLLELDEPLVTFSGPYAAFVAMLILELLGLRLCDLDCFQTMNKLDLLVEDFLLGIIAAEQLGLCGEIENCLIKQLLTSLSSMSSPVLPIEVLHVTHKLGHLDPALNRGHASCLHFPTSSRTTPRTDFSESSDDDNLLQIDDAMEFLEIMQG